MAVIAFIGLGQMGSPMASNLLKQGPINSASSMLIPTPYSVW